MFSTLPGALESTVDAVYLNGFKAL